MKVTDKRSAILQATLELITTQGFHATPMSQISKHAKVAAGTIYHHFASKEEMIEALYATLKEEMGNALTEEIPSDVQYKERFFKSWFNLYKFFTNNPMEFKFLEQYANSPNISKEAKEENVIFYQGVIDFLVEGMQLGILREMPTELMVNLVYGHVVTVAKLEINKELKINEKYLKIAAQSSWDGVKVT